MATVLTERGLWEKAVEGANKERERRENEKVHEEATGKRREEEESEWKSVEGVATVGMG